MKSRVYLRPLRVEDYKTLVVWHNDPDIQNMVGGHKYFVSEEREKKWIENVINSDDRLVLAVCLVENDKHIGNIMLQEIDWINRSAHVPVLIGDKTEWNKGYATEARMQMLKFAFEERGIERVWAVVVEDNIGSIRMLEKCGYVKEGVLRRSLYKNGRYYNQVMMGVLRDEFYEAYNRYVAKY